MLASSQTRELLADAPFVVLLAARTISMLGMAFAPVALAFSILALPGADAGTLSIVLAAQTIPLVAFMLVGGVVADRYPRSLVLLWGQLLAASAWSVIGAMLLTGYTPLWLLCVASAIAGMSGAAVYLAQPEGSPLRQLVDGWGEFRSRQWLFVCVLQWAVLLMVLQASQGVLGPVVAKAELGGAPGWTAVLAGEALGAIVGVAIAMAWRPERPILVATLLTFAAAAPQLLLGVSAPLWVVVVSAFLTGIAFDLFGVLWMTTMQQEVPAESLSRVASYDALGSLMLGPVGLLLAGPAATLFGVHNALIGTGVVSIATTVFALCFPDVRRLRSRHRAAPDVARAA